MKGVIADASFWVALANRDDTYHQKARLLQKSLRKTLIITTDEVLTEFLAHFSAYGVYMRRIAVESVRRLMDQPNVLVLPQTRETFLAGLALYEARPDKEYSLTDCISMQTMRSRGCLEALTTDHHFSQEGFQRLLDQP